MARATLCVLLCLVVVGVSGYDRCGSCQLLARRQLITLLSQKPGALLATGCCDRLAEDDHAPAPTGPQRGHSGMLPDLANTRASFTFPGSSRRNPQRTSLPMRAWKGIRGGFDLILR